MIDSRQPRPTRDAPRAGAATPAAPKRSGAAGRWILIGGIVLVVLAIGRCSSSTPDGNSTAATRAGAAQEAIGTAVAAQRPLPVEPLRRASVDLGIADVGLASREGLAGEMIYSQNCYDALGRRFTWTKLDVCGAFDAGAALALDGVGAAGFEKETAWFQSETAAGRYLKAATAAGDLADAADERLAAMQARARRTHPAVPGAVVSPMPDDAGENAAVPSDGDGPGTANAIGDG